MAEQDQNSLIEIPIESYLKLRDKFKVCYPKHIAAFSLFNTFTIQRRNCKVFSLNGDYDDGTFIAMVNSFARAVGSLTSIFFSLRAP